MPIEGRWYTTEEVANMLERQEQTISRAATRNGIGTRIHSRRRLFTDADVKALRAICHGKRGVKPYKNVKPPSSR